jgi:hypothetical protein
MAKKKTKKKTAKKRAKAKTRSSKKWPVPGGPFGPFPKPKKKGDEA